LQTQPNFATFCSPALAERRLLAVDITVLVLFLLLADLLLAPQLGMIFTAGLHQEATMAGDLKLLMGLLRCTQ